MSRYSPAQASCGDASRAGRAYSLHGVPPPPDPSQPYPCPSMGARAAGALCFATGGARKALVKQLGLARLRRCQFNTWPDPRTLARCARAHRPCHTLCEVPTGRSALGVPATTHTREMVRTPRSSHSDSERAVLLSWTGGEIPWGDAVRWRDAVGGYCTLERYRGGVYRTLKIYGGVTL